MGATKSSPALAALCFAALGIGGCTWSWEDLVHHSHGSLDVLWTVNASVAPSECTRVGASAVEVRVRDDTWSTVAYDVVSCEAFGIGYSLDRGWYSVTAVLVDDLGRALTDVATPDDVFVARHATSTVSIEFVAPPVAPRRSVRAPE